MSEFFCSYERRIPSHLVARFWDGISQIISSSVNAMSEEFYAEWIAYLIATAERTDLMGFSDHIVDVVVKGL